MNLEDTLARTFESRLDGLDVSPGDVDGARSAGHRMRVRRRVAAGVGAAVVVAAGVAGIVVSGHPHTAGPSGGTGHWRELPAAPLSPRAYAESVWTGREVLVLGGETDPCPPNADCAEASQELRDGAAYDPATNTWREIPPAPVPVGAGDRLVVADGVVVLRHAGPGRGSSWFTYEPDHNRWSRIDSVPPGVGDLPSAIGPRVYVPAGRRIAVYDVRRFEWSLLPPDPSTPALAQRRVTATPAGPVVTGYDATQPHDGSVPSPVIADVFDGRTWHRLPASGILGNDWSWAGDRMVDLDSFAHQGIDPEPGFQLGGLLDPATGQWSPLADSALETPKDGWSPLAIGPGTWTASWGLAYDVSTGEVATLPRPDGAPDLGTTAAWAGARLLAFGGVAYGPEVSPSGQVTNQAWLWTP